MKTIIDGFNLTFSRIDDTHFGLHMDNSNKIDTYHVDELKTHPNKEFQKLHGKITKWLTK